MKKIVKYGWVGRKQKPEIFVSLTDGALELIDIYTKGSRENWEKEEWPPIKVRITVEEVE